MPKMPKAAAAQYSKVPNLIDMLNIIRENASTAYLERVPVATQDNINEVGNPITSLPATLGNEFLSSLANLIGMQIITSKMYNNPLKEFKRGMLTYGETIEEIFVNLIKAEPYYLEALKVNPDVGDGMTDWEDALKRRLPDVQAVFHKRNRQDKYPATISNDDLRTAFLSYTNLGNLVTKIVESLYSSDEQDEFLLMKHIFFEAGKRGALKAIPISPVTDKESAENALIAFRGQALNMRFMSSNYNFMGVSTFTRTEDIVIFILASYLPYIDVKALAAAFNMEKADFLGRVIPVDDFGGLEGEEGVVAIMADKDWFMVFDNFMNMTEMYNPARLYWNYFLHHWQTLSYSPFKNAVAFVTTTPTVTEVTITPPTATAPVGKKTQIQLTASVTGTGLVSPEVEWYGGGDGVTVDKNGLVTITTEAAANSYSINAKSVTDGSKVGLATITVESAR